MHEGKDRHDAVVEAVTTAGRSVMIAGATVVIAVCGLMFTALPYMYGVALSASFAVLVVMVAAITLLPALLSFLGPRVDRLRIPLLGRQLRAEGNGESPAARWSHGVQKRPWIAAIAATALLIALALPALDMRLGFPDAGNDKAGTMTREAYDLNAEGFGPGVNGPLVIGTEFAPEDRARANLLADRIREEPGVQFVPPAQFNDAGDAAIIVAIPEGSPQDEETSELVHTLRDKVIPRETAGTGIRAELGGLTAAFEDQSEYITGKMPLFIAGVVGLSFLLLLVAFHSPLISLKAGVMNLLSVGAAYGVMTLVANGDNFVAEFIGIDQEVPIAPFMPVMMFAILFGLSMDYEVFLISRIREEYLKDGDTRRAVADGLAKTARVITAAAAIMVVVFLAFVTAQDTFLKLFGIGLATAVFLDATVIRMILVPAVMQLLDDKNWWIPDWLERTLPRLDVEVSPPEAAPGRP
jgi:RND superfamily putative drug exporter